MDEGMTGNPGPSMLDPTVARDLISGVGDWDSGNPKAKSALTSDRNGCSQENLSKPGSGSDQGFAAFWAAALALRL